MKKGDVAISHLIYIVLGLIVLGVIIYFLYLHITGSQINCQRCSAELTSWCSKCYMGSWNNDVGKSQYLQECVGECMGSIPGNCNGAENFCKAYIPI